MLIDPDYNPSYDVLIDLRHCTLKNDPNDVKVFVEGVKRVSEVDGVKNAFLVDTPNETAMAALYQEYVGTLRDVKIFCTYEVAMAWLEE